MSSKRSGLVAAVYAFIASAVSDLNEMVDAMWAFAEGWARQKDGNGLLFAERGQTNMTGLILGLLIAAIVVINVFIPVVNDAISSSNVSGTTKTILDLLSLFAGLLLLVALAAPLMNRI